MLPAVRIAWFGLPLAAGPALAHGLRDASTPVQLVASALAWLLFALTVWPVMGAPSATGCAYERPSFMRPRMYGSRDR